jgi:hypothetical protein
MILLMLIPRHRRQWTGDGVSGRFMPSCRGDDGMLFVAGTCTYQSRFYPLLDHVVLLTIPTPVAIDRLANRTTNAYGKKPAELRRELSYAQLSSHCCVAPPA